MLARCFCHSRWVCYAYTYMLRCMCQRLNHRLCCIKTRYSSHQRTVEHTNMEGKKMGNIQKEVQVKLAKGLLDLIILQFLNSQPMHGYQVITKIRKSFGVYFGPSTIYPLWRCSRKRLRHEPMEHAKRTPPKSLPTHKRRTNNAKLHRRLT